MSDESPHELPPEILASLRAPVPVDDEVRERHLGAALAHFDALEAASAEGAPVVDLRSRRRPALQWLGAAAAVLIVAAGVFLVSRSGSPPSTQTADRAEKSASAASQAGSSTTAPLPAAGGSGSDQFAPASTLADGGQAQSAEAPAAAVPEVAPSQQLATGKSASGSLESGSADRAPAAVPSAAPPGSSCRAPHLRAALLSISTTVVDGRSRLVFTYVAGPDGTPAITVTVDATTCART